MAKQRPTWAKRMKELRQMEKKQEKAAKRANKRDGELEDDDLDVQKLKGPMDPDHRAELFDGLF